MTSTSNVVYIGHLPDGFYEPELRQYFKQFGTILKIRLSRSKKTGKSKGYGWIQFSSPTVAKIASDSMNNYLMFEKILKCKIVPKDKVHKELFKGSDRFFTRSRWPAINAARQNKLKNDEEIGKQKKKLRTRLGAKNRLLEKMGIKYTFKMPGISKKQISNRKDQTEKTEERKVESRYEMYVDSSDAEITFKTPPNVVKKEISKSEGKGVKNLAGKLWKKKGLGKEKEEREKSKGQEKRGKKSRYFSVDF